MGRSDSDETFAGLIFNMRQHRQQLMPEVVNLGSTQHRTDHVILL
jgi:hypothetical protein